MFDMYCIGLLYMYLHVPCYIDTFVACIPFEYKIFANKIRFLAQAESLISVRGIGESFGHAKLTACCL